MTRWLLIALAIIGFSRAAFAANCENTHFDGRDYAVCEADAGAEEIRLFLNNPETGELLGSFGSVNALLREQGLTLDMAMNAGMYHRDRSPVGLYLNSDIQEGALVTSAGPGNFGMLPNGVFCIGNGRADVYETLKYRDEKPACKGATQSGPMLVINGQLHHRFLKDSDSLHYRNGVGTSADGRKVYFAISNAPVTFYEFGRLFRDHLQTPNALYLDGSISRLYAPAIGRDDLGLPMGPIVGIVRPLTSD